MSETEVNEPVMARPTKEEELLAVRITNSGGIYEVVDLLMRHIGSDVVTRAVLGLREVQD